MAGITGIQRVTLTIAQLLSDRMERRDDVIFTFGTAKPSTTGPRVNIFLYLVRETPYLRNEDDPRRPPPSDGKAALALELGYLITTYSGGALVVPGVPEGTPGESLPELDAQAILADAMRVLHDIPMITAKTPRLHGGGFVLDPSLQNEYESIRIAPRQYDIDDITKLWTAFREDYQRSVAYQVSVLRIDPLVPKISPLPALQSVIQVQPSPSLAPVLQGIDPFTALPMETIALRGERLTDSTLSIYIIDDIHSGFPAEPVSIPFILSADGVSIQIPDNHALFLPGPKRVEARVSPFPNHELSSNPLVFNLAPAIDSLSVSSGSFNGATAVDINGKLLGADPGTVGGRSPLVAAVLFGGYPIPAGDVTFVSSSKLTVVLNVPDIHELNLPQAGQSLPVRVSINGVASRTWRWNTLSGAPEPNPDLLFTVT